MEQIGSNENFVVGTGLSDSALLGRQNVDTWSLYQPADCAKMHLDQACGVACGPERYVIKKSSFFGCHALFNMLVNFPEQFWIG